MFIESKWGEEAGSVFSLYFLDFGESVEECLATEEYFIENSIEGKLRLDR